MLDAAPRRTEQSTDRVGVQLLAAAFSESNWEQWVLPALAFLYGLGVLIVVIRLLVKSSRIQKP